MPASPALAPERPATAVRPDPSACGAERSPDPTPARLLLSPPDVGPREADAVARAVASGWVAPVGPDLDAFEAELAERVGVAHAVGLSSGTAALHLGLLGLGVGPGDAVLTPTLTFAATANAVVHAGATPWFVDCDPRTGNVDPSLLRRAVDEARSTGLRPAALLPVDLLGKPVDHDAVAAVAAEHSLPVLVDAAESLGATWHGRPSAAHGDAAVVSFNGNKIMTTSGGGALLTDDAALARRARHLATQAREPAVHYEHHDIGYNYRLSNVLAALGRVQLSRLDEFLAARRRTRETYRALVTDLPGVDVLGGPDDSGDNCWLTAVVVDPDEAGFTAGDLVAALDAVAVESRPLWKPLHLQRSFAPARGTVTGAAEALFCHGVTLPSGSALRPADLDRVTSVVLDVAARRRTHRTA